MPETFFKVKWPNGQEQDCYSPSSVVSDYFTENTEYTLQDFISLSEKALNEASERVKLKFGFYCSSAADQLSQLKSKARQFEPSEQITILTIRS